MNRALFTLKTELTDELINDILPFWMDRMEDGQKGGFYGRINGNNLVVENESKGGILNARILWTFSAAFNFFKDPAYLQSALRSFNYIKKYFIDPKFGGMYWSVSANGDPLQTRKHIYCQAFFIYGLAEYYLASGNEESLMMAIELYNLVEKYSFDSVGNGYFESYTEDWKLEEDLRLSAKDANEKKTMNTHLHVLEAYTNLYRVWNNPGLKSRLLNLIHVFENHIIDPQSKHLNLFFDTNWKCKSTIISYGHDIEASWLLYEAAEVVGEDLVSHIKPVCIAIAQAASEGLQTDGSLINESNFSTNHTDRDRHWWPQAEAMIGYFNAWELTGKQEFFHKTLHVWDFIKNHLVDRKEGEWFWSIRSTGEVNHDDDKAGFWKCPYHNSRSCLEIIRRI